MNNKCCMCGIEEEPYSVVVDPINSPYAFSKYKYICKHCVKPVDKFLSNYSSVYHFSRISIVQTYFVTGKFSHQIIPNNFIRNILMFSFLVLMCLVIFNTFFIYVFFPFLPDTLMLKHYFGLTLFITVNLFFCIFYIFQIKNQIEKIYMLIKLSSALDQSTFVDYSTTDRSKRKSPK